MASMKAQMETTRIAYERTQKLFAGNLASQSDLDTAKGNFDSFSAQFQAASANVDSQGAAIGAQEAQLSQSSTNLGYTNCVVDAFPGEVFHGTLSQIRYSPNNVSGVVTYPAVVDVENPEGKLRPGMTSTITIRTREAQAVPKVPNAALRFRPAPPNGPDGKPIPQPPDPPLEKGQGRVWLLASDKPGDEKVEAHVVAIGITDGISTEIKDPSLALGTKVVTDENETKKKGF
jgi:multidrug efflux pump subunit AcrA (membrane-fusion protein)